MKCNVQAYASSSEHVSACLYKHVIHRNPYKPNQSVNHSNTQPTVKYTGHQWRFSDQSWTVEDFSQVQVHWVRLLKNTANDQCISLHHSPQTKNVLQNKYRKTSSKRRVPNKRRVSNKRRGFKACVLIIKRRVSNKRPGLEAIQGGQGTSHTLVTSFLPEN